MRNAFFSLLLLVLESSIVSSTYSYADDGDYEDYAVDTSQVVQVCDESLVEVANITITCDSPYTFYYGNGAKRSSPTCDYGDKVTLSVDLTVTQDIESAIYVQMSAYNSANEQLFLGSSVDLCSTYIGSSCLSAGDYAFTTNMQFQYIDGSEANFVPIWEIAFSDTEDGGYDLGGVNIECDMDEESSYIDWVNTRTNTTLLNQRTETFAQEYGILFMTSIALVTLAVVLARQNKGKLSLSAGNPSSSTQLLNQEVL
eukprot:CAMPEP_0119028838 /NCGR_PEP_ID=MMETSP1176-20130426/39627_1 /TAXON_ID=265551 /ORGANISM="Synedropsis recta cf, Strain CCMP1620" /LENGTH=255 /DNA_ID=CAMNT_0006985071 /DNA_START=1 /DNA_END=768 /DNA_ORIENTATION=+